MKKANKKKEDYLNSELNQIIRNKKNEMDALKKIIEYLNSANDSEQKPERKKNNKTKKN